jgi:acyl carrier protein
MLMSKGEIFNNLKNIFDERFNLQKYNFKLSYNFEEDLGFDSLDLLEYVLDVEDYYHITIPDDIILDLKTVSQLVDYLLNETMC